MTRNPKLLFRDMSFGQRLAFLRGRKGWTLRDLAYKTGISNPYLSQIETGKIQDPGLTKVLTLARVLSISIVTFTKGL